MSENQEISKDHEEPKLRCTGYWIPIELSQLGLSKIEQFLLATIDSLTAPAPDFCFASNRYLAEHMQISESRVSFYITKFRRMKLIEVVKYDGRRRRMKTLKNNWFPTEDSKKEYCVKTNISKKEYCVKTRSQTTCFREPYRKADRKEKTASNTIEQEVPEVDSVSSTFAAAAFLASEELKNIASEVKASPPPISNPIYPCLKDLDFPEFEKQWLTDKYSEETIQNAIGFAQQRHQSFKLPFVGVIKFAAQKGLKCEIQQSQESSQSNADLCKPLDGKTNPAKTMRIDVCHDRVEFICSVASILPAIVPFDDKNFKQTMHHHLVKYGFMK